MSKPLVSLILVMVVVGALAAFFGVGFGVGALSVTGSPNTQYTQSPAEVGSSYGDGLSWQVTMPSVASGSPMTTALLAGYQSTPLDFGFNAYSKGDCGTTGQPLWAPGNSPDYGFYAISFGGQLFSGLLDGQPFMQQTVLFVSVNHTVSPQYCGTTLGGGDDYTPGLGNPATIYQNHTLVLTGIYQPSVLTISLVIYYSHCDGGFIGGMGVCAVTPQVEHDTGDAQLTATASTLVQSGYGTATVNNPGNLVSNGGSISVTVATGYAGSNGWHVSLLCPSARTPANGGCTGGLGDSRFANQSVPNDCSGCLVTWSVPAGTSQNDSTPGWNTWEVNLFNGLLNIGYAPVTINILSPSSPTTPLAPGVAFHSSGSTINPTQGDTLTLFVFANVSSESGPIVSIAVWGYYLLPGQNPVNEPECGSVWITTGCPNAEYLGAAQVSSNGANGLVGTFPFTVAPVSGTTQMGFLVESFAKGQQGSPIVSLLVQVAPNSCKTNPNALGCGGTHAGASLWSWVGPLTLSIAIAAVSVLALLWLPGVLRFVAPVVGGIAIAVVYLGAYYQNWFGTVAFVVGIVLFGHPQ